MSGGEGLDARTHAQLESASARAWEDFLCNRVWVAERRAHGWLHLLPAALAAAQHGGKDTLVDEDTLVVLADLAYIAGAVRGDKCVLQQALSAYDAFLERAPASINAMRMRAETLLRLQRPVAACDAFARMYAHTLGSAHVELEVASFRLIHDAEALEHAVRCGADAALLERARSWRSLATLLEESAPPNRYSRDLCATTQLMKHRMHHRAEVCEESAPLRRTRLRDLTTEQRLLLGGTYGEPLPLPPKPPAGTSSLAAVAAPARFDCGHWRPGTPILTPQPWSALEASYTTDRLVVIDNLLSPSALHELQSYAAHGCHFRSMRAGYLGAFPTDGALHPLLIEVAAALASAAPRIFDGHPLALWWLFKYSEHQPAGIGLHADPAAVNVNLWLTEDDAWREGGGLIIYRHVLPLEQPTQAANREFESKGHEAELRAQLTPHGRSRISYKCNRAVIFRSDQWHESEPFVFESGYTERRLNLTFLFGDRWKFGGDGCRTYRGCTRLAPPSDGSAASVPPSAAQDLGGAAILDADAGWDVFSD